MDFHDMRVSDYMTTPVVSADHTESLSVIHKRLLESEISSVAITKDQELVGLVSRTDLLKVGRRIAQTTAYRYQGSREVVLDLPAHHADVIMTRDVFTVAPADPVAKACDIMTKHGVHRVFVTLGNALIGVFSTLDAMHAIVAAGCDSTISSAMSSPVISIENTASIAQAIEKLDSVHVSGLIVCDDEWPVGVFTQVEAMAAKDLPSDTAIDEVMDPALLCLPTNTTITRAAQMGIRMRVRRIAACSDREIKGILSGLDFARMIANA